ncbi:MAG: asparaginase [Thermoanaerobaculia bacterium]
MSAPLVQIRRGGFVESVHSGSIAVVDSGGRLIAFAGNPELPAFLRSAAKPFQAIPLVEEGGVEEFELTTQELALICASHGGEPQHIATAAAILRKGDFDESDLLCGAHPPLTEKAAAELRQSGEPPTPLHNNCSGKHAGMLLATRLLDVGSTTYIAPEHPVQQRILETVGEFAGLGTDSIPFATDGCGVPTFRLSLYRAALAYARLMASASGDAPGALDRYVDPAREVVDAMTGSPEYVAGEWSITTPLMQAFGGDLLAKEGAEGYYAMAISPEILDERFAGPDSPGLPVGVALKIDDGSMERGRNPAILRILEILGIGVETNPALESYRRRELFNAAGTRVGETCAEFDLIFL